MKKNIIYVDGTKKEIISFTGYAYKWVQIKNYELSDVVNWKERGYKIHTATQDNITLYKEI